MSQATEFEKTAEQGGWLSAYLDLRAAGLYWKKAAFAAWEAAPKSTRQPDTMLALAYLLNYKSEQVFYKWRRQDWYHEIGVNQLRQSIFTRHLAEVDRATIAAAINGSHLDRRLYYEQAGRGPVILPDFETERLADREFERALERAYAGIEDEEPDDDNDA